MSNAIIERGAFTRTLPNVVAPQDTCPGTKSPGVRWVPRLSPRSTPLPHGRDRGEALSHVFDQLLRERRNDALGQSFDERLFTSGGNLIWQRLGHTREHGKYVLLLDGAVARKLAPIGNSDSPDVIVIADLHRHALLDQFRVGKLGSEIVERR